MKRSAGILYFTALMLAVIFVAAGCGKTESEGNDPPVDPIDTTHTFDTNYVPAGWSKVGTFTANDMIWSITSDPSGNVYVAGAFTNSSGYCYVAKWNGSSWNELGNLRANGSIYSIACDGQGNIFAVGAFTNGAVPGGGTEYVAMWDGSQWKDIGGGGGTFVSSDNNGYVYKERAMWDKTEWGVLCSANPLPVFGTISSIIATPDGSVRYAGGDFSKDGGYRFVARCDGFSGWNEVGALNANSRINSMVLDKNGNLYAAGAFTDGNLPSTGGKYVAKWDGTSWTKLGDLSVNEEIYFMAADPVTGDIYASGYFTNNAGNSYIARWNGTAWSDVGNLHLAPAPIHVTKYGKLYSVIAMPNLPKFNVVVHN